MVCISISRYTFLCNEWLRMIKGHGCLMKTLEVASHDEVSQFSYLLGDTGRKKLAEHHIVFSIFYRPFRSNFTRAQRLSLMMSFLFLTMITSAMFYRSEENVEKHVVLNFGFFSIGLQELFVSAVTIAIVFPVNLLVIIFFKRTNASRNRTQEVLQQLELWDSEKEDDDISLISYRDRDTVGGAKSVTFHDDIIVKGNCNIFYSSISC